MVRVVMMEQVDLCEWNEKSIIRKQNGQVTSTHYF